MKIIKMLNSKILIKNKKKNSNGMVESNRLSPDYDNDREKKYLNVFRNKTKKRGKIVTPEVRNLSTDYDYVNDNIYINFSFIHRIAECGAVTLEVRDQSDELGLLHRHPGANPGRTASAPNFFLNRLNLI